jgi:hypothetical protein
MANNPTPPADSLEEQQLIEAMYGFIPGVVYIGGQGSYPANTTIDGRQIEHLKNFIAAHDRRRDEAHRAKLLEAVGVDEPEREYVEDNAHSMKPYVRNKLRAELRQAIAEVYGNTSTEAEK